MSITAPCLTAAILEFLKWVWPFYFFAIDSICCYIQAQYISQCMGEIKKELKQENMGVKANAISKLTYVSTCILQAPPLIDY